jgi:16S rRNA (uracil1498-N3)-methyltransferase
MHVFYTPDIETDQYILNEDESKHCSRVLRLNLNDTVHLIDGRGGFYEAIISSASKKNVTLSIVNKQFEYGKRNHYLHIAIAPTKNIDRLEWFLEKATEIGIDEITPIICDRSERKIVKEERLEKVITSAVKQSLTAYHPKLNPAKSYSEFVKTNVASQKFIAHCMAGDKVFLNQKITLHQSYTIIIGPEGDFTPNEVNLAIENNYSQLSLGSTRLRTETAALAACFETNLINRVFVNPTH